MTEEEYFRKNYPDSCYGDRPLSPHWDFFQAGVEFGERQSEKKIAELKAQRQECERQYQEKVDDIIELQAKIETAKEIIKDILSLGVFGIFKGTTSEEIVDKAEQFLKE